MILEDLFDIAVKAAEKSYSKYSGFRVGAALLTDDRRIFTGCNIENVSYSMTMCAERIAIFKAVSKGIIGFSAMAIAGSSTDDFSKPCVPCGACLQVLDEFCEKDFLIILSDGSYGLSSFLPYSFSEENMK